MDSNRTVADVIAAFSRFNYPTSEMYRRLNRSSEHLLNSDVFCDIYSILEVTTTTGFVTMPREYGRAYGAIQDCAIQPILSQWTPFVDIGMARLDPGGLTFGGVRDLGNHFCTQSDVYSGGVQQPGILRFTISNVADAGKNIRFNGTTDGVTQVLDASGNRGFTVVTANPTVDTGFVVQSVDGLQLDTGFVGRVTLSKVIGTTVTQIGTYDPGETRPQYTRYQVDPQQGTVRLIAKRKHVDYIALTDWVFPDNLDVLEVCFEALTYRDRGNFKGEEDAYKLAKKYLKETYAATVPYVTMQMSSDGFGASLWRMKRDGRMGIQVGLVTVMAG